MKKIIIDTRFSQMFGAICKSADLIAGLAEKDYEIELWIAKPEGMTSTSAHKQFTWDPNLHPTSYFNDLIGYTFRKNLTIRFMDGLKPHQKFINLLFSLIATRYLAHYDYAYGAATPEVYKDFKRRLLLELPKLIRTNFQDFLGNLAVYFYLSLKPWKRKPIHTAPFIYALEKETKLPNFSKSIKNFKQRFPIRILISVTWDDDGLFEPMIMRRRGVDYVEREFQSMIDAVKGIHEEFGEEVGFILASKKAVDWQKILPLRQTLDCRHFEDLGMSLSECIFTATSLANFSINWPSSFCVWTTSQKDMQHFVWGGSRDCCAGNMERCHLALQKQEVIQQIKHHMEIRE